jgi:hypothetical protein
MRLIQLNCSFRRSYEPHTATFQLPQSCFGNVVLDIPLRHSSHARPQRHVCRNPGPSRIQASACLLRRKAGRGARRHVGCAPALPARCLPLAARAACASVVRAPRYSPLTAPLPPPQASRARRHCLQPRRARAESPTSRTSTLVRWTLPVRRAALTAPSRLRLRRARALRFSCSPRTFSSAQDSWPLFVVDNDRRTTAAPPNQPRAPYRSARSARSARSSRARASERARAGLSAASGAGGACVGGGGGARCGCVCA